MMIYTRRSAIRVIAGSAALAGGLVRTSQEARAQKAGPSPASAVDARLMRAIENAPWVASPGNSKKPVYVLWAPWCPYCHQLMKDLAAGQTGDIEFRWIGASPKNEADKNLIGNVFKFRSFELLKSGLLHQPTQLTSLQPAYVDRIMTGELLLFTLQEFKSMNGGYPAFVYYDGKGLMSKFGYANPSSLASLGAAVPYSQVSAPSVGYLDDAWAELGAATGQPHRSPTEYTIYALPSENAMPLKVIGQGTFWPGQTKRKIGVKNQKWLSVESGISIGQNNYDGYIRLA